MKVHRNTLVHSLLVHACGGEVTDLGRVQAVYEELNEDRHENCERKEAIWLKERSHYSRKYSKCSKMVEKMET